MPTREIEVKFKATSDDAQLQAFLSQMKGAEVQVEKTGKAAKDATGGFNQLKDGLMQLGQTILGLVALEKIGNWLLQGAEGAAKEDRALRQVSEAAVRWGMDGTRAAEVAKDLADAMLQLGIDEQETYKSFREFVDMTHSLEEAQNAAALSAEIAAAKDISYGEAQSIVTGLIQGRKGALREAYKLGVDGAKDEAEALEQLTKKYHGYTETLDDAIVKKQKFKAELDNVAEEIGGPVNSAISFLIDLFHGVILLVEQAGVGIVLFAEHTIRVLKDLSKAAEIDWTHPVESYKKFFGSMNEIANNSASRMKADFNAAMDELDAEAERRWGATGAKLGGGGKIGVHKPKEDSDKKEKEDTLKEWLSYEEAELNRAMEEQEDLIEKYLKERRKAYLDNSEAIVDITEKQIKDEEKARQVAWTKEKKLLALEQSVIHKTEMQQLKEKRQEIQGELALARAGTEEEIRLKQLLAIVDAQITTSTMQTKKEALYGMLAAAEGAAGKTLGLTTAMAQADAIAGAISAAKTAEPWYMKIVAVASVMAYLIQLVGTIKSIALGGGQSGGRAAKGGLIEHPNWIWAGEEGPELIIPAHVTKYLMAGAEQHRHESQTVNHNNNARYAPTIYYSPTNLFGPEKDRGLRKVAKMLEPAQRYNAKNVIKPKPRASKATGRGL